MKDHSMPHHPQDVAAVPGVAGPELAAELTVRLRWAGCVFAEEEAQLLAGSGASADDLAAMVGRRTAGIPLEHVLG
jgi:release factor glutamine methyltransferase